MERTKTKHTYRLRLGEDGLGEAREIEFDAPGADIALSMAHQFCGGRRTELFEDGRKLADLQLARAPNFWIVDSSTGA